jgi:sugar phosphate isomerase/epimerase
MPPILSTSFKNRFPFTLATTSFIYANDYAPNVRRLGPFVDEIELLLFESGSLPSRETVRELAALSREHAIGYNIHLPSDVSIGHSTPGRREVAVASLLRVFERVFPLSPSTLTLHIPWDGPSRLPEFFHPWKDRVRQSLVELIPAVDSPARISVETLDYPLEWLGDVIDEAGLAVCADVGHLLLQGPGELPRVFDCFGSRVSIIHLHGVENGRDHLPLDRLPKAAAETILNVLADFRGIVSLEVFAFDALEASLKWLDTHFKK